MQVTQHPARPLPQVSQPQFGRQATEEEYKRIAQYIEDEYGADDWKLVQPEFCKYYEPSRIPVGGKYLLELERKSDQVDILKSLGARMSQLRMSKDGLLLCYLNRFNNSHDAEKAKKDFENPESDLRQELLPSRLRNIPGIEIETASDLISDTEHLGIAHIRWSLNQSANSKVGMARKAGSFAKELALDMAAWAKAESAPAVTKIANGIRKRLPWNRKK